MFPGSRGCSRSSGLCYLDWTGKADFNLYTLTVYASNRFGQSVSESVNFFFEWPVVTFRDLNCNAVG